MRPNRSLLSFVLVAVGLAILGVGMFGTNQLLFGPLSVSDVGAFTAIVGCGMYVVNRRDRPLG